MRIPSPCRFFGPKLAALLALLLGVQSAPLLGAIITWTGSASSDWANPVNWSPPQVPTNTDIVTINSGSVEVTGTVTIASLNVNAGTLGGSGTVVAGGPLSWTGGTISGGVQCNGGTISAGTATLNGGRLVNTGGLTLVGSFPLLIGNDSVISNLAGATFDVAADLNGLQGTIYNAGLLRKTTGPGVVTINNTVNNTGNIEADSGTLRLANGGTNSGTNNASGTAILDFGGGTHTLDASSRLAGSGTVSCSGGVVNLSGTCAMSGTNLVSGGTMNFDLGTSGSVGAVTVMGGTLGGSGTVAASGPLSWTGGTISGGVQCNGGTISAGTAILNGGRLVNTGGLTLVGSFPLLAGSGSVISNLVGATFELAADLNGLQGTIFNAGLLRKTTGTGVVTVANAVNNTSNIEADSGTLRLANGGTNSGTNSASGTAILDFGGGTHTLDASSHLTGSGTVSCSGGVVDFSGTCAMSGTNLVSGGTMSFDLGTSGSVGAVTVTGGTLGGSGTVVASGPLSWIGGTISGGVRCNGGTISAGTATLNGGRLVNTGGLTLVGSFPLLTSSDSVISNLAGATFELAADLNGLQGTIYNAGLLRKTTGTGVVTVANAVNNTGNIEVDSGTIAFSLGIGEMPSATLSFGLHSSTDFGRISLPGPVAFTGALCATVLESYIPASNTVFTVMTFASYTGDFTDTNCLTLVLGASFVHEFTPASLLLRCVAVNSNTTNCGGAPTGLVGWWPGEDNANDRVGTNNGTLGAGVSFVDGEVGRAFNFTNGPNSYIALPNSPAFQPSNNQLTIEAWIKPDFSVTNTDDHIMVKRDGCTSPFSYVFAVNKGDINWGRQVGNVAFAMLGRIPYPGFASTNRVPNDGQFHHVAVTFDGNATTNNCVIYLDGQVAGGGTAPGPIPITASAPVIGAEPGCGTYSRAAMDEVSFYNRALAPSEIAAIFAAGSAGKCGGALRIYSTGLDDQFKPLPAEARDPHYTIVAAPAGTEATPFAPYMVNTNGYPFNGAWRTNDALSQWVGARPNYFAAQQDPVRSFTYRTTFDLTGVDPASVRLTLQLLADNALLDVKLNGLSQGISFAPTQNFLTWGGPFQVSTNFVPGTNTLDFLVQNGLPAGANPCGLRVQVSGTASNGGAMAPFIIIQPQSQTNMAGTTATFAVTAGGTDPLTYQWRFDGTNITGATATSLALTNVQPANAGRYDVVVSNSSGSATSQSAFLTVLYLSDYALANTNEIRIRDFTTALPYPAVIAIVGLIGAIQKVTVTLSNLSHPWPADIDALLVGPQGQSTMLMSDAGGDSASGVTLTLDDDAAQFLPEYDALVSGTFKPTDIEGYDGPNDALAAPAPAPPYGANLTVFFGTSPNGSWKLFVQDDTRQLSGYLHGGWSLALRVLSSTSGGETIPLRILPDSLRRLPDGRCQFTIAGQPGQVVEVLASADLQVWVPSAPLILTNGFAFFTDATTNQWKRFYRAHLLH